MDTTAPDSPVVLNVIDKNTSVSGSAEPQSTINVYANGKEIGNGLADATGAFTVKLTSSLIGVQSITVFATDKSGNKSEATTVSVKDTTAPPTPVVNPLFKKDYLITGKAEANSTVVVTDGKKVFSSVTVNGNGEFSILILKPLQQKTELYFVAIDQSANVSEISKTVVQK